MKKITVAVFTLCTVFAFYGCGSINEEIDVRPIDGILMHEITETLPETEMVSETAASEVSEAVTSVSDNYVTLFNQSETSAFITLKENTGGSDNNSNTDNNNSGSSDNSGSGNSSQNNSASNNTPSQNSGESENRQAETQKPAETAKPVTLKPSEPSPELQPAPVENNPELKYIDGVLIVNKSYPVSEDYVPSLVTAYGTGSEYLTYETNEAFKLLCDAAWAEGYTIWCQSGYRSYSTQNRLYTNYAARDGKTAADTYSARPGYSEHQTGLALDLNSIDDSFAYTGEGIWVADNCWKYGFIIRYPKGKEDITGYKYEPWHLRYVGTELAETLYSSGLTLEEHYRLDSKYSD